MLRWSPAYSARWCSTRPPVAMPLADRITMGRGGAPVPGFVGGLHHGGAVREGVHLRVRETVFVWVAFEQAGGADGHGAVQKHRQRCRKVALFL